MKILDQLVIIKNSYTKPVKSNSDNLNISVVSKINNSFTPQSNMKIQINLKKEEEIIYSIEKIILTCEENLKEMDEIKKNFNYNKSILLDATIINQNSFYIPQLAPENILKNSVGLKIQTEEEGLLNEIEEKFKIILCKLTKIKSMFTNQNVLVEKKNLKQIKLEKLRSSYTAMKKIYENALRNGYLKKGSKEEMK